MCLNLVILVMKVLLFITLGTLFNEGMEAKCDPLLMCPSFCMKVQKGCYVCDCGTFSNYLRQASDKMAEKSNTQQQQQQTGTRLSSYTSGYGMSVNENYMSKSNDQRIQDYKNMMELGLQFINSKSQPLVRQNIGSANPGLLDYGGHRYQNMPGMNCKPVDSRCPSSCWNTNVFTGCIHCACDDQLPKTQGNQLTPSTKIPVQQGTPPKPFENLNTKTLSSSSNSTTVSPFEHIPTPANNEKHLIEHVFTPRPYFLPNFYPIKVPTKPPTQKTPEKVITASSYLLSKTTNADNNTRHTDDMIPTLPPQKVNISFVPTLFPNTKLNYMETTSSLNKNKPYGLETETHTHVGYPTPAFIPEKNSSSAKTYSWEFYPEQRAVNLGHYVGTTNRQFGSKFDELTNISNAIDLLDLLRDNSANLMMRENQQIKPSDAYSIFNPLPTPFVTPKMDEEQATEIHSERIQLNHSLPYVGHGNYNPGTESSQGVNNYMGFYGHSKMG